MLRHRCPLRGLVPFALAMTTAACASDAEFARQLAGEGPNAIDPAEIAVAVLPPDGLGLPPEGAALTLSAKDNTGWAVSERFTLVTGPAGDAPGLPTDGPVTALTLAAEDVPRFRTVAREVGLRELETPADVSGSFAASVDPCLLGDNIAPSGPLRVYLRLAEDRPYRLLREEADFVETLIRTRGAQDALPRCPEPGHQSGRP